MKSCPNEFASVLRRARIIALLGLVILFMANPLPMAFAQGMATLTTLHYFGNDSGGNEPLAGLLQASDGNFYGTTSRGDSGGANGPTLFKLTPDGTFTVLYHFGFNLSPDSELIQTDDGSIYGTANGAGNQSPRNGGIFRLSPDGSLTVVHYFNLQTEGGDPVQCGVTQASDGNIYGLTTLGGTEDHGTFYRLNADGTIATLHSFVAATEGSGPQARLVQASDHNFYGTTTSGGMHGGGTIFRMTLDGTLTVLHQFAGGANDGSQPFAGLVQGSDGYLYGTTPRGGSSNDNGTVFRISLAGQFTVLHSFTGFDGGTPNARLVQATDGNFYGTSSSGGQGSAAVGTVFKITPAGTFTNLHTFTGSDGGTPESNLIQATDGKLYGTTMTGNQLGAGLYGTVFHLDAGITPTPTPSPTAPPHGGLSPTTFTVNGSSAKNVTLTGPVLSFAAQQAGRPGELTVRVQSTQTPLPNDLTNTTWTDLPTGTGGRMTYDVARSQFVLNTTGYPAQAGLYFRAISAAPGYPDSISDYVGFFDGSTSGSHLPPVVLLFKRNGTLGDLSFTAGVQAAPSDAAVRIQSSTTPGVESSWSELADGHAGHMTRSTNTNYPDVFLLLANKVPAADHIYFRAIAQKSGYLDSISNAVGAYTLINDTPPTVTAHPPAGLGGSGTPDDPIIVPAGQIQFSADATPDPQRHESVIATLKLQIDGATIQSFSGAPGSIDYRYTRLGEHTLEAVAIDDLGATSRAGTGVVHILVVPTGDRVSHAVRSRGTTNSAAAAAVAGKTYRLVRDGALWNDETAWVDAQEKNGVPGPNDIALVGHLTVRVPGVPAPITDVGSVVLNGGGIVGGDNNVIGMTVETHFTIYSGRITGLNLTIGSKAICELLNMTDVAASGAIVYNYGSFFLHGAGGCKTDKFFNYGLSNFQLPISIPSDAGLNPLADTRLLDTTFQGNGAVTGLNPNALIAQESAGVISNDGAGLVAAGGGNIISHDGGGIISHDGGGIISHDGGGLIGNDGAGLVAAGGGNLVAAGGGNFQGGHAERLSQPQTSADSSDSGFTQTSGEFNLSAATIVGSVTLNGGVFSGSGLIVGDLTNDGGYISPGHSPGSISVSGNFTQGANGTLIVENGGATPDQFDQLLVNGAASLGGKLDVKLINGYTPDSADTFSPLGYGSASGSFASVSGNAQVSPNATGLLVATNPAIAGPAYGQPFNISTRLRVLTNDNVLIGGFIVTGAPGSTKAVLIRGKGPSLAGNGLTGVLADPFLELHKGDGTIVTNDNWQEAPNTDRIPDGFAPTDPREAIIIADLAPGNYTVIEKGAHGETGIGLTEVYDLDGSKTVALGNISTRGFVDTGDNVMIGGFIVGGSEPASILVRATGPSLTTAGLSGVLEDPVLELHDANGNVLVNDNWRETQESEIIATTIPPADDKEPAILANLVPGNYTAIVRGKDDTTGVALVEVYKVK